SDLGLSGQIRGHGVEEDEVEGGNLRGHLGGDRVEVRVRGRDDLRGEQRHARLADHVFEFVVPRGRLGVARMAPRLAVGYWPSAHSATFCAQIPTRSPFFTPRSRRPMATASLSRSNSA